MEKDTEIQKETERERERENAGACVHDERCC